MTLETFTGTFTGLPDPLRAVRLNWSDAKAEYRAWVSADGVLQKKAYRMPHVDTEDPTSIDLSTATHEKLRKALEAEIAPGNEFVATCRVDHDAERQAKADAAVKAKLDGYRKALNAAGFDATVYEDKDLIDLEGIFANPEDE